MVGVLRVLALASVGAMTVTPTVRVCVNSNACGRAGYGFGPEALRCVQVLADVITGSAAACTPGPCMTQCSRGVNAEVEIDGRRSLRFGVNNYAACASLLG